MRAFLRPERNKVTPLENTSKQHSTNQHARIIRGETGISALSRPDKQTQTFLLLFRIFPFFSFIILLLLLLLLLLQHYYSNLRFLTPKTTPPKNVCGDSYFQTFGFFKVTLDRSKVLADSISNPFLEN